MALKGWSIRKKGMHLYSKGSILSGWDSKNSCKTYYVQWTSKQGKVWTTETALKEHLFKYTKLVGMPNDWEVTEINETVSKPVEEWFDANMTLKLLKR